MCIVKYGTSHGCAPIPEEEKWVYSGEIKDISGLTRGIDWCTLQQGAYKLTLNAKESIVKEALIETIGCSGMIHSAVMVSKAIVGETLLKVASTDPVCDAISAVIRELFLRIVYGRTQSAFSENGLPAGAGLEDSGKGTRSQVGTVYSTKIKGSRYLDLTERYILKMGPDEGGEITGYEYVNMGVLMDTVKKDVNAEEALNNAKKTYGRYVDAVKYIDPQHKQEEKS